MHNRREFLGLLAAGAAATLAEFPASIQRALAIGAARRSGTIRDVEHIVILTQENRSFDHYFGALGGVRGFADPFPIPVPDAPGIRGKNVWYQPNAATSGVPAIVPFHLNTVEHFEYIRLMGTPHAWPDAQQAWNHGRMNRWPLAKRNHSMGYFAKEDIPFQWALANAFTICDAYHCAIQAGTIPNRLFLWTGTNDPLAKGNGPATYNDYEWFDLDPGEHGGYTWISYCERLEEAGISWQIYERMDDNFTDNPLAGFAKFRDAWYERPGYSRALRERGVSTRDLDLLRQDVLENRLPQVSWVVGTAEGSEHPGPSSPAQGAAYTARVLNALTANPDVWSKTVLLINFDENDGFFDHIPPPAPPSYIRWHADPSRSLLAGASTESTTGEYHEHLVPYHDDAEERELLHRPYGLGPRVPLYVISPWSKGGWVDSQVFDHTSILRFIEARFGVREPNISAWRRAVCGDLTSAFDFANPESADLSLPDTRERAARARKLSSHVRPPAPESIVAPVQEVGIRPSRALPYELEVTAHTRQSKIELEFSNRGSAGAVFHVYDRFHLEEIPRRYTVGARKTLADTWSIPSDGAYDLWVLGPNGFHRHHRGNISAGGEISLSYGAEGRALVIRLLNGRPETAVFHLKPNKYYEGEISQHPVEAHSSISIHWALSNGPWYDFTVTIAGAAFLRRFAGRVESGGDSFSDPAMSGPAILSFD